MKRSRFSDEQIIGVLKEQEAGAVTADVCRRHGISEATFYKWKAKFGGLEVTEATPVAIISAIEAEDMPSEWIHSSGARQAITLKGSSSLRMQPGPVLFGMEQELLISVKFDAGARNQLDLLLNA